MGLPQETRPLAALASSTLIALVAACPFQLPPDEQIRWPVNDAARVGDGAIDSAARDAQAIDRTASDQRLADQAAGDRPGDDRPGDSGPGDLAIPDATAADRSIEVDAMTDAAASPDTTAPVDSNLAGDTAPPVDSALATDAAAATDAAPAVDAAPLVDAGPPPLYGNDFTSGTLDGLTVGDGTWGASDGLLLQSESCNSATDIVVASGNWTDFTAQVRVRFDAPCASYGLRQVALLVRVVSVAGCSNRYYGCLIDVDNSRLMIADWDYACVTYDNTWIYTSSQATGVWYTITADMVGDTLTCTVSGGNLPSAYTHSRTDYTGIISAGSVGLATWEAAVSIDDLQVEAH